MSTNCSYDKCENRYRPFCDCSFFKIPNDEDLRLVWLKHCGNESALLEFPKTQNWKFYVCEMHFLESDIHRKGTRTNLSPNAVPYSCGKFCKCVNGYRDERCTIAIERAEVERCRKRIRKSNERLKAKSNQMYNVDENAEKYLVFKADSDAGSNIDLPANSSEASDVTLIVDFNVNGIKVRNYTENEDEEESFLEPSKKKKI